MNYLAHLFLAKNTPEFQIGNLLGDFVKGSLEKYQNYYHQDILQGIKHHRQIDYFTDNHPIFIQSKNRISQSRKRFAGIIIDIGYDRLLSSHWKQFSEETLEDFITRMYNILENNQNILPEKLQKALPRMIEQNWLGSYQTREGINLTFQRIAKRIKRVNNLATAQEELINNYKGIEKDFLEFFPELYTYAKAL